MAGLGNIIAKKNLKSLGNRVQMISVAKTKFRPRQCERFVTCVHDEWQSRTTSLVFDNNEEPVFFNTAKADGSGHDIYISTGPVQRVPLCTTFSYVTRSGKTRRWHAENVHEKSKTFSYCIIIMYCLVLAEYVKHLPRKRRIFDMPIFVLIYLMMNNSINRSG